MDFDFSTIEGAFQALSISLFIFMGCLGAISFIAGIKTTI